MKGIIGRTLLGAAIMVSGLAGALLAPAAKPAAAAEIANIRVIHGSPDAPAVDVYVNEAKAISNLAFKDVSPWAALPAGTYDIKVTAAGGTDAVIQASLPLESGKYYTVVATGQLANITPRVFMDDLSTLEAGKSRLRIVHTSPDAPAVDVAVTGGPVLVSNLAFPQASDYLTVDAGTVDVEVRAAGTETVALPVPGFTMEAGKVYSVFAVGLLSGTPALSVLPVVDDAMPSNGVSVTGMPATGGELYGVAMLALAAAAALSLGGGLVLRARRVRA